MNILRFTLFWCLAIIASSCFWFKHYFGVLEFEQIFYHLQFGVHGQLDIDPKLTKSYFYWCFGVSLMVTIVFYYVLSKISIRPYLRRVPFALIATISTLIYFADTIHITDYINISRQNDYIAQNYIEPKEIVLTEKPRNLILIYVESLEYTYTDVDAFGENLLYKISSIPGDTFTKYKQSRGCSWTMAGLVSSMCGIPLKPKIIGNNHNKLGAVVKKFLPGAICLSDILANHGYKNVYIGGANYNFAGKGKFLYDHSYDEVIGRSEFEAMGMKEFHHWGLYDDLLFEQAKLKLADLRANNQPYNLTLLTLDMHQPGGHISTYCAKKGVKDYFGIVKCTSDLVYDFYTYLERNGYLENTVLAILGDHVLMSPDQIDDRIAKSPKRAVYNKFVLPERLQMNRDEIVHFDVFPTILYTLGFRFPNNKLGLGISGYGEFDREVNADRLSEMRKKILLFSDRYAEFWLPKGDD